MTNYRPLLAFIYLIALHGLTSSGIAFASHSTEKPGIVANKEDATEQLRRAIAAVDEATRAKALWIPASEALERAKTALEQGDYETAVAQAQLARDFAELGLKQADSPPYRHF